MCGRYNLDPFNSSEIAKIIAEVEANVKTGEVFPTNTVPVLMEDREGPTPAAMVWGYPRFGAKSGSIINARSETAGERPMFRKSLAERRCVVPTTGFYEWGPTPEGKKQKYLFRLPDLKELYLAGLWNDFAGERRCVILTTAANASMAGIHDRMPVVLTPAQVEVWIQCPAAAKLLDVSPPALECERA